MFCCEVPLDGVLTVSPGLGYNGHQVAHKVGITGGRPFDLDDGGGDQTLGEISRGVGF